ncbi:MAG: hypothetical protein OEM02_00860 [Desulfobulbaceae bacterium]|nr:hypothetical protein [Desulfobulbaceae bacterium]
MKRNYLFIVIFLFSAITLLGCAPKRDSLVESFSGTSFALQKYNQIAATKQQVSTVPPAELDGEAAVLAHKLYINSFEKPKGPEYSLTIGSVKEK